jgi:hypothetical protein
MVGNDLRPAETVADGGQSDPLLDSLVVMWPELTEADRLALVGLAERLSVANRDGLLMDD